MADQISEVIIPSIDLYVDMYDCDGVRKYTRYSYFHVEGSSVN